MQYVRHLGCVILIFFISFNTQSKTLVFSAPRGGEFSIKTDSSSILKTIDLKDSNIFLVFGFTNCKSICPFTLRNLKNIIDKLPQKDQLETKVLFISVDNERDRYEQIKKYLKPYGPSFIGGTETDPNLKKILELYGARYYRYRTASGKLLVDHTSNFFLMNKKGLWTHTFDFDASAEQIQAALLKTNLILSSDNLFPESRRVEIIPQKKCLINLSGCSFLIDDQKFKLTTSESTIRPNTTYKLQLKRLSTSPTKIEPLEFDIQGVELSMGYNRPEFKWNPKDEVYESDFEIPQCELQKMNWTITPIFRQNKKYKALQFQLLSEDQSP